MSEIRMLDELGAEFDRVARAARPRRRRRWFAALLVVLLGGVATVPATRAGIDDLAGWLAGDDVGQPAGDDAPDWLTSGARLIAESEGAKLYVGRHGDTLDFAVGEGFGTSGSVDSWRKQFADRKVIMLGPASVDGQTWDKRGRFPLMGVTARSVTRVELTYKSGPPASVSGVRGGFVLWVQATRPLRELIGFDGTGAAVGRVDISRLDLSKVCRDARGCPPGNWTLAPRSRNP
jgi:hypothetical protein